MLHDVVDDSPVNDYTATDNGIAMDTTALLVATTGESASTSMEATFYSSRVNRTQGLYESPPGVAREHRNDQGINRDITTTEPKDQSFQHTAITVEPTETSLNHRDRHPSASTVRCQDRYPSASTMVSGEDVYIQSSRSRIFCGQDRSSSPFGTSVPPCCYNIVLCDRSNIRGNHIAWRSGHTSVHGCGGSAPLSQGTLSHFSPRPSAIVTDTDTH